MAIAWICRRPIRRDSRGPRSSSSPRNTAFPRVNCQPATQTKAATTRTMPATTQPWSDAASAATPMKNTMMVHTQTCSTRLARNVCWCGTKRTCWGAAAFIFPEHGRGVRDQTPDRLDG